MSFNLDKLLTMFNFDEYYIIHVVLKSYFRNSPIFEANGSELQDLVDTSSEYGVDQ